jgi:hypothetical protein
MAARIAGVARVGAFVSVVMFAAPHGFAAPSRSDDACTGREAMPSQIRPFDCRVVALLTDGLKRSPTLRRIVDRIGELKGIVYIAEGHYVQPRSGRALTGALSHEVAMAGAHTVLRVTLALESGDRPIATLAHELQHAVEVLESPARNEAAVDALFERIGSHEYYGIFETGAAIGVEHTVARELVKNRP